jgi:pre-rRNA-processing protein TSR4
MQVMPQLLDFFRVKYERDSLDWATIVVYICWDSCDQNDSYKEEFVWVQLSDNKEHTAPLEARPAGL